MSGSEFTARLDLSPAAAAGGGRLEQLLNRLDADADFPALSAQVVRVQALAGNERENLHRLAEEILKDVGLTQKLLRLVNAAPYVANRGGVATVSRALSLLGMSAVRGIASSLVMLEKWENHAQADRVRETFARSLLAAHLASDLYGQGAEREEVFLAALFQGLGRMLTECFFPGEAESIRQDSQDDPLREQAAVMRHLGVGYDELALAVARQWGLPADLRRSMERPTGPVPPRPPQDRREWVRWLASAGSDLADAWLHGARSGSGEAFVRQSRRYAPLVGKAPDTLADVAKQTRQAFLTTLDAVGLAARLRTSTWRAWLADEQADPLHPLAGPAEAAVPAKTPQPARAIAATVLNDPAALLALGLQDATTVLLEGGSANQGLILDLGLETLQRALGGRRVWLVTPGEDGAAQARRWWGADAERLAAHYRCPVQDAVGDSGPLFVALGRMRKDSRLEDLEGPRVQGRLPEWYREAVGTRWAMMILPLWQRENWLGWLHVDGPAVAMPAFGPVERALVRALRNLMVMALAAPRP